MNSIAQAALVGFPLAVLALAASLGARRAVIFAFVAGWLLLPEGTMPVPGFFDIDKRSSLALASLLACVCLDSSRIGRFRARWFDAPVVLWCTSGFLASWTNGLGAYDALTELLRLALHWGVPWFLGRIYLRDLESLRLLCVALFVGGLVYAPLCLWEVRMSPTIHGDIYGFRVYEGITYLGSLGKWGARPSVMLRNPLELGLAMTIFGMCGVALSTLPSNKRMAGVPTWLLTAGLIMVSLVCKNLGATVLLGAGLFLFFWTRRRPSYRFIGLLAFVAPGYMITRSTDVWDGSQVVQLAGLVHSERAISFDFRLQQENVLVGKALQRPVFGWGGWGRSRVYDDSGRDVSVTDGLWIIALGMYGLLGLCCLVGMLLTPVIRILQRVDPVALGSAGVAPLLALLILLILMTIDFVANNHPSPPVLLAAGGLASAQPIRAIRKR